LEQQLALPELALPELALPELALPELALPELALPKPALEPVRAERAPVPRELLARTLPRARPRERSTRARGSMPDRPQQQISINASSVHHLSRKNEPIDQWGRDGQSSSQQIDLS
jgi:hypothetical protein